MLLPLLGLLVGALMPLQANPPSPLALSASLGKSSLRQGESSYGIASINDLSNVQSLVVSVYFDADNIDITSHSNQTTAMLVDGNLGDGYVRYSYLFGDTSNISRNLLRYNFTVHSDAPTGSYRFDVLVEEAYGENLDPIDIDGTYSTITVSEAVAQKTATISAPSLITVNYGNTVSLSYSLNKSQIASGYFEWTYDDDALDFVNFEIGNFLTGKTYDVAYSPGSIKLTFLATEYGLTSRRSIGTLKFSPNKNATQSTTVSVRPRELFDLELDAITATSRTTTVYISQDASIIPYNADVTLTAFATRSDAKQVDLKVHLGADSHLGAGDFTITFDPDQLSLSSYEKRLSADFFTVNDKKKNEGTLKFSIISMSDIVDESDVLTLTFDVLSMPNDYHMDLGFSGSGLSDSLTEPIALRFLSEGIDFEPYLAEDYATDFLDSTGTICASSGDKESQLSAIWDDLKEQYSSLIGSEKSRFSAATPAFVGESENVLERALGRYIYIVNKYGFENYVGSPVSPTYNVEHPLNASSFPTWVIPLIIGSTALMGTAVIIKRKHN